MSIAAEVDIANLALAQLGQPTITALSDSNARARVMNTLYEPERDALFECHDWNFASKRKTLTIPESDYKRITDITQANPAVATSASHGLADGDYVLFENVVGMTKLNGNRYEITGKTTNTINLLNTDSRNYTAYHSSKTVSGATQADPVVITTSAAHGLASGDVVNIASVGGMTEINNRRFTITVLTTTTFELDDEDGTGHTAYTSGGAVTTGSFRKVPAFGPTNEFDLPSDFMRIIRTEEQSDAWRIEGQNVVSDESSVSILYMAQITTVTEFSQGFIQALAARLAWRGAFSITGSKSIAKQAQQEYNETLSAAMFKDSNQRSRTTIGGSTWLDSRLSEKGETQPSGWSDSI